MTTAASNNGRDGEVEDKDYDSEKDLQEAQCQSMMIFSFRLRLFNIFQRFARHDHKAVLDKCFIKRISLQLKDLCGLFMKKFWRAFANIPSNVRSPSTSSPQI